MFENSSVKTKRINWPPITRGVLFCGAAVLTIWFALFQHFHMPLGLPNWLKGPGDIYLHSAAFAGLTFIATLGRKKMLAAILLLAALAIVLEASQILDPQRTASFTDLGASLSGIVIGWGLVLVAHLTFKLKA